MDKRAKGQLPATASVLAKAEEDQTITSEGVYIGEGLPSVPPKLAKRISRESLWRWRSFFRRSVPGEMSNQKQRDVRVMPTIYSPGCSALGCTRVSTVPTHRLAAVLRGVHECPRTGKSIRRSGAVSAMV